MLDRIGLTLDGEKTFSLFGKSPIRPHVSENSCFGLGSVERSVTPVGNIVNPAPVALVERKLRRRFRHLALGCG